MGLVTINFDGSSRFQVTRGDADWSANVVRLTSTPSRVEVGPVWSPDGTKIAFLGCSFPLGSSDSGIYIVNRDGSGETQVPNVTASFAEANLDWQPLPPFLQDGAPATLTVASSLVERAS